MLHRYLHRLNVNAFHDKEASVFSEYWCAINFLLPLCDLSGIDTWLLKLVLTVLVVTSPVVAVVVVIPMICAPSSSPWVVVVLTITPSHDVCIALPSIVGGMMSSSIASHG